MVFDNDRWATLQRSTPDDSPSTPSLPIRFILAIYGHLAILLTITFTFPFYIAQHLLVGPFLPWMPLNTTLLTRYVKLVGAHLRTRPPTPDPEEWDVPTVLWRSMVESRRREVVDKVRLRSVAEGYRQGIGRCEGVETVERPGFMLTPPGALGKGLDDAREGEKIIFYLVGGAYTVGHPLQYPFMWQNAKALQWRAFGVNYRKCIEDAHGYPAPVLDALSGYLYLIQVLHFDARNILLMGDSAGGHLSLALSRYLFDLSPPLPQPGAIALSSPWSDWTSSFPSRQTNATYDYLASNTGTNAIGIATRFFIPEVKLDPYFSPALAPSGGFDYLAKEGVRVYVMLGTREGLADECRALARSLRRDGVDVKLREVKDGLHDDAVAQWPGSPAWDLWKEDLKVFVGVSGTKNVESQSMMAGITMVTKEPLGY